MSADGAILGRTLAPGDAEGEVLVLEAPLSFWGGMDHETGRIIDHHHPQRGVSLAGRVVAMPGGRGSSSSSSVLAEAIRAGTAPAAIVMGEPDAIVALGSLVAAELYGIRCPVVTVGAGDLAALSSAARARVAAATGGCRIETAT